MTVLRPYVRMPFGSLWDFVVRGWRPVLCWICILVLVVNAIVLPLAQLWGVTVTPLGWADLAVFVTGLAALGAQRTIEKIQGVTS